MIDHDIWDFSDCEIVNTVSKISQKPVSFLNTHIHTSQKRDGVLGESFPLEPVCERRAERPACELGNHTNNLQGCAASALIIQPSTESVKKKRDTVLNDLPCLRKSKNTRWNRAYMGMMLPGDYWFLTLTTSPKSKKSVLQDWRSTWKFWFRVNYPFAQNLWVETAEGLGVIHAIVRFPLDSLLVPPTKDEVALQWQWQHQAFSDWTPVLNRGKLANYMLQAHDPVAGEIRKQRDVMDWNYSRGWLPVGFTSAFAAHWMETLAKIPSCERTRIIADWLHAVTVDRQNLDRPPRFEGDFIIEDYFYG